MSDLTEPTNLSGSLIADMPEADYLAHPALSSSGAKRLLPPSCPARFKWWRDNGPFTADHFDFGHAAHAEVLGIGMEIVVVDAADWRTKAAQEAKAAAHAAGKTPLLADDMAIVRQMAEALRLDPIAYGLLAQPGRPEVSLFWQDDRHGVERRARIDYLPDTTIDGHVRLIDYKTCASADPYNICKAVANYGYHQQAAWYIDGVQALGLAEQVEFLFIFQEKWAPYLTTVVELDAEALTVGRGLNDRAIEVYARCVATDTWPSYSDDIETVSLPIWAAEL